jgi:amino acid transporter
VAHDVFISYSQHDKAPADAVCHRLEEAGIRCWIAPRDVAAGKRWAEAIVDALSEAKLVIVIFTAAANASRHVLDEVSAALDIGRTVIPFRLEDIGPTGELRLHLGGLHWLDALSPPLDDHIDRLIETTKRNLPSSGTTQAKEEKSPTVDAVASRGRPAEAILKLQDTKKPTRPILLRIWLWTVGGALLGILFCAMGISGNAAKGNIYPIAATIFTSILAIILAIGISLLIRMLVIGCTALSRGITRRVR